MKKSEGQRVFMKKNSYINREGGLKRFLKEISQFPLLTPEEETEAAKAHDYNKLVCHNLRFAVRFAHYYDHMGDMYELLQCACEGMIKAAKMYDAERSKVRFIGYASPYMKYAVLEYLRKENTTLKRDEYTLAFNIKRFRERYMAEYGVEPAIEEIADALGESEKQVEKVLNGNHPRISMDQQVNDEDDIYLGDCIKGDMSTDIYTCRSDRKIIVADVLRRYLTPKEASVLRLFYGIDNHPMCVGDIAVELDLTTQRINQLKKSALTKLAEIQELKELL